MDFARIANLLVGLQQINNVFAAEYKYASTQINLPRSLADKVRSLAKKIPNDALAEDGRETEPHITVLYGLHHESPSRVKFVLRDEEPFSFTVGPLKCFPANEERPSDVLVATVHSDALIDLNKKLQGALPHVDTHPEYTPHITIAYLKPGMGNHCMMIPNDLVGSEGVTRAIHHSNRDGEKTKIPLKA